MRLRYIYDNSNAFVFIWRLYYIYRRLKATKKYLELRFDCDSPNSSNLCKNIEIFIIKYLTLATFRTSHQNYSQRGKNPKEQDLVKKSLCWQHCFLYLKIPLNVLIWSRLVSMITLLSVTQLSPESPGVRKLT